MQKKLYLFIEGDWDKVFFETFLDDDLRKKYDFEEIMYIEFAERPESRTMLRRLVGEGKVNFLLCPDLDAEFDKGKRYAKIKKLAQQEFRIESEEDITTVQNKSFVVVQEIESWYLAGFNEAFCNKNKLIFYPNTEKTNKSTFVQIAKQLKKTPLRLRDELTKNRSSFSIKEAEKRNESFRKFFEKVANQIKRLS